MRARHVVMAVAVACAGMAASDTAGVAQEKATGIAAYRQAVMRAQAGHSGAIQVILTDQTQLLEHVAFHAGSIQESARHIPEAFPEGSMQPASRALPVIWERWDDFQAAAGRLEELAGQVVETSRGGDVQATLAAFGAMGRDGCGGCHNTFRAESP